MSPPGEDGNWHSLKTQERKYQIMAMILKATYTATLAEYSTHQLSLSLQTKVMALSQVRAQSARIYALLRSAMKLITQNEGLVPGGQHRSGICFNGQLRSQSGDSERFRWRCSRQHKKLLLRYLKKCHLDRSVIERVALERFGKPVHALRGPEARRFIQLLHE